MIGKRAVRGIVGIYEACTQWLDLGLVIGCRVCELCLLLCSGPLCNNPDPLLRLSMVVGLSGTDPLGTFNS